VIPLCLQLRNFMSYGESTAALDFNAFHVACLCGENGHGKSALLDAITWALWGRARGKSEDDLVQLGKLDMEVQLELALAGERYLVARKRTLRATGKRRIATPMLELQIHDGEGWRPLTGESVGATQARLLDLLKMDYETFINSAYLMQGRADEFTLKSPAERKKVLADLLGLERYGRLEERAREESRRCLTERQLILSAVQEIDRELARRPTYEAELAAAGARIGQAEERRRTADAELNRWRAELRAVEERASQVEALRIRHDQDERECATLRARLGDEERELARLEALVARGPEVRDASVRLGGLRAREEALGRVAGDLLELNERSVALEREIGRAREGLVAELASARAEASRLQALAVQGETLARELESAQSELAGLQALDERRDAQRQVVQRCQVEIATLGEANSRLKVEMADLKQNLDRLSQAGASCPVCRGRLTPAGRAAVEDQIEGEGKTKAAEYRANALRARELEAEAQGAQNVVVELEKRVAARARLESRLGTLKHQHEQAWAAAGAVVSLTEIVAALDARLQGEQFLPDEHAELRALRARIEATGYDRGRHDTLRSEIAKLRPFEALRAEVEAAEGALAPARARRAGTAELLSARQATLAATAAQLVELAEVAGGRARIEAELARASAALDAAIAESRAAHQALGVAQQQIEHCRHLDGQRAEKLAAAATAGEEKTVYDELALAFGKKGIQAMIIESAIPEIEAEANELLGRLSDGGLSLSFETQREAKSGEGVIETLDIKISDEFGTRDYEMYSGGEAFRINFAIRIALSKLLARRAGAQLQLLVIDEGFGTQDATGRERLVEAINAVSADFEKILVVTHIQELKDAFPVRIDVAKGPEGSQIVATAVLEG
jgi:exonuclease SbcC